MTLIYSSVTFWEETAPVKLPTRYCLRTFFPFTLASAQLQMTVSLSSRVQPKPYTSNLSSLHYAVIEHLQYQARVKLTGSFRLSAARGHLHPHCIFTELLPETVPQSLRHSCTSELTRQGISLFYSSRRTLSSSSTKWSDVWRWSLANHFGLYKHFCM
jgi:hypothetical protein